MHFFVFVADASRTANQILAAISGSTAFDRNVTNVSSVANSSPRNINIQNITGLQGVNISNLQALQNIQVREYSMLNL